MQNLMQNLNMPVWDVYEIPKECSLAWGAKPQNTLQLHLMPAGEGRYWIKRVLHKPEGTVDLFDYVYRHPVRERLDRIPQEILPHLSLSGIMSLPNLHPFKEGFVQYFAKLEHVETGRLSEMRTGRFLRKYLIKATDEQVKNLTAACNKQQVTLELGFSTYLMFNRNVYMHGPSSCMSGRFPDLAVDGEEVHPQDVYWYPENGLALAYLKDGQGRYVARCIVNTETMTHSTVYASRDSISGLDSTFKEILEEEGYSYSGCETLSGVRLRRIDTDCGGIVCPYIDPDNLGVEVLDDYLIANGEYEADHETGCLQEYPPEGTFRCDHCGDSHRDEPQRTHDGDPLCEYCAEYHYMYSYCPETCSWAYAHVNSVDLVSDTDGDTLYIGYGTGDYRLVEHGYYEGRYALLSELVECAYTGHYWHEYDIGDGENVVSFNGKAYSCDDWAVLDGSFILHSDLQVGGLVELSCNDNEYNESWAAFEQYSSQQELDLC